MKQTLLIGVLVLVVLGCKAQAYKAYTDSLTALLDTTRKDTVQLQLLYSLQDYLWKTPVGDVRLDQMGALAKELLNDPREPVRKVARRRYKIYLNNKGVAHWRASRFTAGLRSYKELLRMQEVDGDTAGMALTYNNMGLLCRTAVDAELAVKHFRRSMQLTDTSDKYSLLSLACYMARTYADQGVADSALAYADLTTELGRGQDTLKVYLILTKAEVYALLRRRPEAVALFKELYTLTRSRIDSDINGMHFIVIDGLSKLYRECDSLPQALAIEEERMSMAKRYDRPDQQLQGVLVTGVIHAEQGRTTQAARELEQAIELATVLGAAEVQKVAASTLAIIYAQQGRYADAMDLLDLASAARDSLSAVGIRKELMTADFHQQQLADSLLQESDRADRERSNAYELAREHERKRTLGYSGAFLLLVALGIFSQLRATIRSHRVIAKEKAISERLLQNILPAEVAEELKTRGHADARHYEDTTVLFTDFKGFTAMSEQLSPKELIRDIHECFSAFDRITEKHGIEKIKTIGDAYMAAGGLPTPNTTHATNVIKAAFEMRDFIAEGKARKIAAGLPYFEIRIGIHTGPVVAGIVGVKKFQYDIWGDTVNTASRMESSGEVGQVNISGATYELVRNEPDLTFTPRGKVQAKGKGEMEMYFARKKALN
jgi:class 3 adenylate cyclase